MTIYRIPVETSWSGPGTPGVNVWHARVDGAGGALPGGGLQGAVDSIHAFYKEIDTSSRGSHRFWAAGTLFQLGQVVDVDTQEVASARFDPIGTEGGVGDAPHAAQIVVGWRSTIAARRGQGRTFLGPLAAQTVAADGSIEVNSRNWVLWAAQGLVARNKSDNGWGLGVYGLEAPKKQGGSGRVLRDFTGASVNMQFSVLRSRRD